jgi:hypothetical protein
MTMTHDRDEALFRDVIGAARAQQPAQPGEDLLARVMADADRELDTRAAVRAPRRSAAAAVWAALGGWAAVGPMAAAGVTGLWIGMSPPVGLSALSQGLLGAQTVAVPLLGDETLAGLEEEAP